LQAIRKKYPYDHVHNDASLQDILKELAAADSVRNLREAPEPECANAVNEQYSLLQQMIQQANDCEEEAMVVHLDSETSADTKQSSKSGHRTRKRSPEQGNRRARSSSRRGGCARNKCPHCKHYRRYAGKHNESKCYFNKNGKDGGLAMCVRSWR
jgi:hypothetical protein